MFKVILASCMQAGVGLMVHGHVAGILVKYAQLCPIKIIQFKAIITTRSQK